MYGVQHAVPVKTGAKPFICLPESLMAHLDVIFEDGISARERLDIGQPLRSNQLLKEVILNLGIRVHRLESLLDGVRLKMPEIKASKVIKNAVVFWRELN